MPPDLRIDIPRQSSPLSKTPAPSSTVICSATMIPALPPTVAPVTRSSPLLTPLIPLHGKETSLALSLQSPAAFANSDDTVTVLQRLRSATVDQVNPHSAGRDGEYFSRMRQGSFPGASPEDPSSPAQTPSTPSGLMGRLLGKMTSKRPPGDASTSPIAGSVVPSAESNIAAQVLGL